MDVSYYHLFYVMNLKQQAIIVTRRYPLNDWFHFSLMDIISG